MALTFLQGTTSTADTNSYTFSSQNLGTASSDRYIIVGAVARKAGASATISSITIGGVSATIVKQQTNTITNTNVSGLAIAAVPTGTTGNIVVTFSATMLRCAISAYAVTELDSATPYDDASSTSADPSVSLDIPTDGFAIGMGLTAAASTATWTGLTEDVDGTLESFVTYTSASDEFPSGATGRTITIDFGSTNESSACFVSWGFSTNTPPTVALNTPTDAGETSDTTPDLVFTGTDAESDDVRYNVEIATTSNFLKTITLDTAFESTISSTNSKTVSVTVADNTDRLLAVGTSVRGAVTVTSATYNGDALTKIRHDQLGGDIRTELWYILNPDVGTANLVVNFSGTQNVGISGAVYYNVDGLVSNNGNTGSTTTSTSVTNTNATTDLIVDVLGLQTGSGSFTGTVTAGQTKRNDAATVDLQIAFADKLSPSANNTMSWSFASNYYAESNAVFSASSSIITDVVSGTDSGFSGSPDNTDPFASAQAVTYTVQSALDPGTYYWRVRGLDPSGSNTYGAWSDTRSFTINVVTSETIQKDLDYTVLTSDSVTKDLDYNIITNNDITKDLDYTVITEGLVQKGLIYEVEVTGVYKIQVTLDYTVLSNVSITKALAYTVQPSSSIEKALQYAVIAPQSITKALAYRVKTVDSITKALTYIIVQTTSIEKALSYEIVAPVTIEKNLQYAVITNESITKALTYRIKIVSEIEKVLAYRIITTVGITKDLTYVLDAPSITIEKALQYAVISEIVTQKALQYTIVTSASPIEKELEYSLVISTAIENELNYKVQAPHTITKGLLYTVGEKVGIWIIRTKIGQPDYTNVAKPTSTYTRTAKVTSSYDKVTKPSTSYNKQSKVSSTWSKVPI